MPDLKIFSDSIDRRALNRVNAIAKHPAFKNSKIRIMPDVHSEKNHVIGLTAVMGERAVPSLTGPDIGCGVRVIPLGRKLPDLDALDGHIRRNIPLIFNEAEIIDGRAIEIMEKLLVFPSLNNIDLLMSSCMSLGGGNHFIEIDKTEEGEYLLVIHTGALHLGTQVESVYQALAATDCKQTTEEEDAEIYRRTEELRALGRHSEIPYMRFQVQSEFLTVTKLPDDLCFLTGMKKKAYVHDVQICQEFAVLNRDLITENIMHHLGYDEFEYWECVHNYIDEFNVIRRGAISAHKGQKVIIPMNMRDGCILGVGKGNPDWNESAPHGMGRRMSVSETKNTVSLDEFEESMKGIYTTTVNSSTIEEAPFAYKSLSEAIKYLEETVEITQIARPVYSFKPGRENLPNITIKN